MSSAAFPSRLLAFAISTRVVVAIPSNPSDRVWPRRTPVVAPGNSAHYIFRVRKSILSQKRDKMGNSKSLKILKSLHRRSWLDVV